MEWWRSMSNVLELARWLDARDELDGVVGTIYYFEKPWKWTPEYRRMQAEQATV